MEAGFFKNEDVRSVNVERAQPSLINPKLGNYEILAVAVI